MKDRVESAKIDCNVVRPVGVWDPCFPLPSTQLAVGHYRGLTKLPWRKDPAGQTVRSSTDLYRVQLDHHSIPSRPYSEGLLQTNKKKFIIKIT